MADLTKILRFSAPAIRKIRPAKFEIRANMDKLEVEVRRNGKLLNYWCIDVIYLKDGIVRANSYVMPDDVREATLEMQAELAVMRRDRHEATNPHVKERRLREEAEREARKNHVRRTGNSPTRCSCGPLGKWDHFSYHGR